MAAGDYTTFDEAKLAMLNGAHDFDTHVFKIAICDNTTAPTAATATPVIADFTQVSAAGTYTTGGDTLTVSLAEAGGTVTFDSSTNPTWLKDASNDVDAYWGIVYNDTSAGDQAIGFIELGGPINMVTTDLTITWDASGLFTLA